MVKSFIPPKGLPTGESGAKFGTDGIRGPVDRVVTPSLSLQIGFWLGKVLTQDGPVLIGMDSRNSSCMISSAIKAGLNASGKDVWDMGLCPTPALPFLIKKTKAAGGVMVSASHNPPEDNGIKVFSGQGTKLNSNQQQAIERGLKIASINNGLIDESPHFGKSFDQKELLKSYYENLLESIGNIRLNGIRIALDLCWGSATHGSAKLFSSLGSDLKILHGVPDGSKINLRCGSTHLNPLQEAVKESRAEMGFAFDGDADRVIAVDNQGRILDGDHLLYLWGSVLKDENQLPEKRIVASVMSNLGFEKAWLSNGGLLDRTPVGDQHIHSAMIATGAGLGGEQSGHILSAAHGLSGDGLLTALQIATICKAKGRTLAEFRDQSFTPFPQKLINIPVAGEELSKGWQNCQPFSTAVTEAKAEMGNQGRILVRPSGTEPLLRVMVEGRDKNTVDSLTEKLTVQAKNHLQVA